MNVAYEDDGYRGIPFGEWLELFLDYAISLALANRAEEAYQVCEAARDSIVFVNSKDYMFMIHVAWAGTSPAVNAQMLNASLTCSSLCDISF